MSVCRHALNVGAMFPNNNANKIEVLQMFADILLNVGIKPGHGYWQKTLIRTMLNRKRNLRAAVFRVQA